VESKFNVQKKRKDSIEYRKSERRLNPILNLNLTYFNDEISVVHDPLFKRLDSTRTLKHIVKNIYVHGKHPNDNTVSPAEPHFQEI
jgi:hypothetical protein